VGRRFSSPLSGFGTGIYILLVGLSIDNFFRSQERRSPSLFDFILNLTNIEYLNVRGISKLHVFSAGKSVRYPSARGPGSWCASEVSVVLLRFLPPGPCEPVTNVALGVTMKCGSFVVVLWGVVLWSCTWDVD